MCVMNFYVSMYVSMNLCMYACMYACMYVHANIDLIQPTMSCWKKVYGRFGSYHLSINALLEFVINLYYPDDKW